MALNLIHVCVLGLRCNCSCMHKLWNDVVSSAVIAHSQALRPPPQPAGGDECAGHHAGAAVPDDGKFAGCVRTHPHCFFAILLSSFFTFGSPLVETNALVASLAPLFPEAAAAAYKRHLSIHPVDGGSSVNAWRANGTGQGIYLSSKLTLGTEAD